MKFTKLISGQFTTGANAKGNFSGKGANGEQIYLTKKDMESFGIKTDAEFQAKKPWVMYKHEVLDLTNEAGEQVKIDRMRGIALFNTQDELIEALTAEQTVLVQAAAVIANAKLNTSVAVKKAAVDQGFTDKYAEELLAASIL